MKYTIEKTEKYTLLQLHEEKLNSVLAPDLKSEFVKLNAEGIRNIILDMSAVKYTDSSGLSSILVGNRLCENEKGLFVLSGVTEHVMKLIKISQLDTVLTILPTIEESIDAVFMNEIEKDLKAEGGTDNES
ncbi:MAG: STAS domain-containing protein [Cytophagaceae bacterium]|nr:STAS domain-containing protein [Cytophagaceae bacterium]MDW8456628.1 STAS domain-containing protein [Cytophagaceae bacterium]